jgi:hypothetical protein
MEDRIEKFFDKELRKEGTLYVTHTSDIITLESLFEGNRKGRPETGERAWALVAQKPST